MPEAETSITISRIGSNGGKLSSSSSIESNGASTSSRRRNMPMMYQMYESQYEDLRGTVYGPESPDFFPAQASENLKKALSGIETNDQAIINILVHHNNFQRQKILSAYEDMYEKSLISDIEEETGGYFLEMALALFKPAHVLDTLQLYKSVSNRYGDHSVAVEIACTRSARQLKVIREQYQQDFKKTLEKDINVKVEGIFGRMLSLLLCKSREEDGKRLDEELVNRHANLMLSQTVDDLSRNVVIFEQIFAVKSWRHIAAVLNRADELRGDRRDIETILRKNKTMHSETRLMLLTIVHVARNNQLYFAEKLRNAMSGERPDHSTIIRVIVTRSEIDMADIVEEYKSRYQRSLDFDIQQSCSGDYLRLVQSTINPNGAINI
ncbi:hypothetical protein PENTCL1PPCAC_2646 [Pristionchus entomophagus]|uniref:Annexin n=1 Tax=Pristionchus entomophagus TaxID=358040 RepID=A0AAV5SB14_9BILA|nr:hypothetical protein PENTCL1PPCAC_2646 [Pristionchus entomophagus]